MIDKYYPEPVVGAVIINNHEEVLVVKSHKWFGKYVIPGGHVEMGETLEEAVKREVKEETNLTINNIHFLHFQELIFESLYWKKKHFIFFNFSCTSDSGVVKRNDESEECMWIPLVKMRSYDIEPHSKKGIEAYKLSKKNRS